MDEDMEGHITLQEYQDALEAFNQSVESHVSPDSESTYTTFEHRCVFKLLKILKERNISKDEFYRMADVDHDEEVNIKELSNVLAGLTPEFYQKDTQVIMNFFDIDRNGECTEKEFMNQLAKAERL